MSKTTFTILCAGLLLIGVGCSTVINTETQRDGETDFSKYETFAFVDQTGKPARLNDPFMSRPAFREQIRVTVEEQVAKRGLRKDTVDSADFLIAIHAGTDDYLRPEMKRWNYKFGRKWHHTDDRSYPPGSLIIDFIDREAMTLIWRGSAPEVLGGEDGVSKNLKRAVSRLIDAYPPKTIQIDSSSV
jgi:uncharacterized protein DUF4136